MKKKIKKKKKTRQPLEWERIFASKVTDKGLISIQEAHAVQYKTIQSKKWVEDLSRHLSKEDKTDEKMLNT